MLLTGSSATDGATGVSVTCGITLVSVTSGTGAISGIGATSGATAFETSTWHWEYHSLIVTHLKPDSQQVSPE